MEQDPRTNPTTGDTNDAAARPAAQDALTERLGQMSEAVAARRFEEAQQFGQQLLEDHPNNAAVHALMGDLAARRRQPRQAVEWYQMSLRLQRDREVSDRLTEQLEILAAAGEEIRIEDDLTEPASEYRRLGLIAILGGVVVVGILITLVVLSLLGSGDSQRPARGTGMPHPTTAGRASETPRTATGLPAAQPRSAPAQTGPGRPVPSTPRQRGAAPGADARQTPPMHVTQRVDGPMSDQDRYVTQALSSITWPTGEALGSNVQALVDPYTGYTVITAEVPPAMQRVNLSNMSIDTAYKLAVAAIRVDPGIDTMTIRILVTVEANDGKGRVLTAFRGNTKRDVLEYFAKRGVQPDREMIWNQVFATTWWNPSVSSPAAAPQ